MPLLAFGPYMVCGYRRGNDLGGLIARRNAGRCGNGAAVSGTGVDAA